MNTDVSISIATINGSGSLSANMILAKGLFRSGAKIGTKNIFPSNISGLPTWFLIRLNDKGHVSRRLSHDVVVARNPQTAADDLKSLLPGGLYLYDADMKITPETATAIERSDAEVCAIPFRKLTEDVTGVLPMRKLLTNMVYIGVLAELLGLSDEILLSVLKDQFHDKESVVDINMKALSAGRQFAVVNLNARPVSLQNLSSNSVPPENLFIDGNSAAALGAAAAGCTFLAWYPITPATSLAESFQDFTTEIHGEQPKTAVIQSEDELSAINMVLGAGWAGARAMTTTSGPGLSLMAEAAGLSYFAEIPGVIWDIQRAGPSTGLPTRTMQGDILAAARLSHGDTEHVVLLPSTPQECFEFAELAFDLAEELQTLVIVLSDLDLGMNSFITPEFRVRQGEYRRGKVLTAKDLEAGREFARYRDVDGDGIAYRTLPGTPHPAAAFFTRGSGHSELGAYTENGDAYARLLDRLKFKLIKNLSRLPAPQVEGDVNSADTGLIYFGSTTQVMAELQSQLAEQKIKTSALRIRALPLTPEIGEFLKTCRQVVVIEQNRDGQMLMLLKERFPAMAHKMTSALQYDGMPVSAATLLPQILDRYEARHET